MRFRCLKKCKAGISRANVDAAYILGICYIQTKDYDQARKAFGKMFDVPPDSAASYLFTARMLLRQEYDPVAEEYAQKAAALDPKLPLVHYLLGELYIYKSRIPEAIAEFQKELAINPAHAATYYKLADAYSRMQKYEDAERLLQRSIWLDATSTGPYILMGKVLEKKGEFDLAVRALQRAATHGPEQSDDPPSAGAGLPRHGEERRSGERTQAGGRAAEPRQNSRSAAWNLRARRPVRGGGPGSRYRHSPATPLPALRRECATLGRWCADARA